MTLDQSVLSHLLSRLNSDLDFLASQDLISKTDLLSIKAKLPLDQTSTKATSSNLEEKVKEESQGGSEEVKGTSYTKVIAIFDYTGQNCDDLTTVKGDVIKIIEENEAWYKGNLNGKTGWFPRNYAEAYQSSPTLVRAPPLPPRLPSSPSTSRANLSSPPLYSRTSSQPQPTYNKFQRKPYYPAGLTPDKPEEPTQVEVPSGSQQPDQGATPPSIPKKPAFGGKIGAKVGDSFVRGVGFGAGMSVVNAIL